MRPNRRAPARAGTGRNEPLAHSRVPLANNRFHHVYPAGLQLGTIVLPFVGSFVAFLIALLIGGLAIYISARLVVDVDSYSHAVVTALIGAVAWAVASSIPLFGPIVALIVWIAVINWRYPGGWIKAAIVGFGAWVSALLILMVVNSFFRLGIGAFGIPGA